MLDQQHLTQPPAPLKRLTSLRESVLERLRSAIIMGEIAEGEVISAPALGQALGVSATPVREAMMDLAREGIVEPVKNKGFRVTAMTDKELDDLAAIRLLIEPPSMRAVAGNIDDDTFEQLTGLADACLGAAEAEDLPEYLRYDRKFHHLVLRGVGNPQLSDLAASLRIRTRLYGLRALASSGTLGRSAREHHELVALLRAGDGAGAEQLMRNHIGHSRAEWATGAHSLPASGTTTRREGTILTPRQELGPELEPIRTPQSTEGRAR